MNTSCSIDRPEAEVLVGEPADASPRIAFFGAAPDTSNMGVSALCATTVTGLEDRLPNASFLVFDNGRGPRRTSENFGGESTCIIDRCGAHPGLRLDRVENLLTMSIASSMGRLGSLANRNIREIDECSAVVDISGGDSFSDIYGAKRFFSVIRPKLVALRRRVPLILLPQTYGPFFDSGLRRVAARIVRGAAMCWARDHRSFEVLKELLGDAFDAERHRLGVDMAFGLKPRCAEARLTQSLQNMIAADRLQNPLIGFNVSGLIYNRPAEAQRQYRLKADYQQCVIRFLEHILATTPANVVLVSHVMSQPGHYESDLDACQQVSEVLSKRFRGRLEVAPNTLDQSQVKWLIGRTDWFCGTRMHSTIAALSSRVPTATISYSDKAKGVFESCGQGSQVVDPRALETDQVVQALKGSFANRRQLAASLADHVPTVLGKLDDQLTTIAEQIESAHKLKRRS